MLALVLGVFLVEGHNWARISLSATVEMITAIGNERLGEFGRALLHWWALVAREDERARGDIVDNLRTGIDRGDRAGKASAILRLKPRLRTASPYVLRGQE